MGVVERGDSSQCLWGFLGERGHESSPVAWHLLGGGQRGSKEEDRFLCLLHRVGSG